MSLANPPLTFEISLSRCVAVNDGLAEILSAHKMCIRCLVLLRASLIKRAGTILIKEEAALTTRQTHIAHRRAVKVVRGKGFILFLGV